MTSLNTTYKTKSEAAEEKALYITTYFKIKRSNAAINDLFNLYIVKKEE